MDSDTAKVKRDLTSFFTSFPKLSFPTGYMILSPDDACKDVYFLSSGRVKQFIYSESGSQVILHILGSGTYFPLSFLFGGGRTTTFYHQAFSPVVVNHCPAGEAKAFFLRNPAIVSSLCCRLWQGIEGLSRRLETGLTQTFSVQVARLLVYVAKHFGEKGRNGNVVIAGFTHQEIADWLGTTRETVSIQMEQLKRKRILDYQSGTIAVHSLRRLELLAASLGVWLPLLLWFESRWGSVDWRSVIAAGGVFWT